MHDADLVVKRLWKYGGEKTNFYGLDLGQPHEFNTSSLSAEIASATRGPDKVLGMHFFSTSYEIGGINSKV